MAAAPPSPPAWAGPPAPAVERARARAARLGLDHGQVMDVALGPARGLSWARLRGASPALAAAREEVRGAHAAGATPTLAQLDPARAAAARALAAAWAASHDLIVIYGEPVGVDALLLAAGDADGGPVRVLACPGPAIAPLQRALASAERPLLVLAGQAAWVGAQARAAGAGAVHALPAEEDGLFAPWSVEALALGALAGHAPEELIAACSALRERAADPAHDVARRLAGLTAQLAETCGLPRVDLVASSDVGARLARVVSASWAAVRCKVGAGAVRAPGPDAPRCRRLGDEAELQRLHEGPGDQWTLCLRELPAQGAPDAVTDAILAAEAALWLERGAPYAQLRFVAEDAGSRLGAALVFVEAALLLAVLGRASPLEMPTADRFGERLAALAAPGMDGAAAPQE